MSKPRCSAQSVVVGASPGRVSGVKEVDEAWYRVRSPQVRVFRPSLIHIVGRARRTGLENPFDASWRSSFCRGCEGAPAGACLWDGPATAITIEETRRALRRAHYHRPRPSKRLPGTVAKEETVQEREEPVEGYSPPRILSVMVTPDITKCMQNTGGISERSTFRAYKTAAFAWADSPPKKGGGR